MLNRIIMVLIATLALSAPLVAVAAEEADLVALFEKYNGARKAADVQTLKSVLVKVQADGIDECVNSEMCGKHLAENLKDDALSSYHVTNFVEFDATGRVVKQRDKTLPIEVVSGPAAQIYYEGQEMRGHSGRGVITFVIEGGEWKVSTDSWQPMEK